VTPLQTALSYSILLNRGLKYTPHVAMEIESPGGETIINFSDKEPEDLYLEADYIDVIEEGLVQVVNQGTAAGRFAGFPLKEIPVAGKTGTAEVFGKQDSAWFVCYAPVENPEYIIVVMLEQAGGGSSSAAPVARKILDYLYGDVSPG
jgi:penicillin-binding protein 2